MIDLKNNKMKNLTILILAVITIAACQPAVDYKAVRKEVMDVHDKVMVYTEQGMTKKMKLDTLITKLDSLYQLKLLTDTLAEKQVMFDLRNKLSNADEEMDAWMHGFQPEIDGKSNEEAVSYFKSEKLKIQALDSLYQKVLTESDKYLDKFRNK
jgi:hypothetical protein